MKARARTARGRPGLIDTCQASRTAATGPRTDAIHDGRDPTARREGTRSWAMEAMTRSVNPSAPDAGTNANVPNAHAAAWLYHRDGPSQWVCQG